MYSFLLSLKLFHVRWRVRLLRANQPKLNTLNFPLAHLDEGISVVKNIVSNSKSIVVVTGPEVAAESGVTMDLRDKDHFLWKKYSRETYGNYLHFIAHPEYFWDMYPDIIKIFENVQPNPTHYTIQKWYQEGRIQRIISETLDDLHLKAGSFQVTEVNGSIIGGTCRLCTTWHTRFAMMRLLETAPEIPMSIDEPLPPQPQSLNLSEEEKIQSVAHCPREIDLDDPTTFKKILVPLCIPLSGEPQNEKPLYEAFRFIEDADLFLALGAKLEPPLNLLPYFARSYRIKIIFVQENPTPHESIADVIIKAKPSLVMKELVDI